MRVLIISTDFMQIAHSFNESFKKSGCTSELLITNLDGSNDNEEDKLESIEKRVIKKIESFQPDAVLDLLGYNLELDLIKRIKTQTVLIKYLLDLVQNYPMLMETLPFYDLVYTYETFDIKNINDLGVKKVKLLYATYDDTKYYPMELEKKYDLCFVGQMYMKEQKKRIKIVKFIKKKMPGLKMAVYGVYARPYQIFRFLKWKLTDNGKFFKNVTIPFNKVNDIYNKSTICLNINSFQTYNTWSSRLIEMIGSGSFVVTEETDDSKKYFEGLVGFYKTKEDLVDLIRASLKNDNIINISKKAAIFVKSFFSLKKTIETILEDIRSSLV